MLGSDMRPQGRPSKGARRAMALGLTEKLRLELERYRNKDFLKAGLAVCALAARADPKMTLATPYRVDQIPDRPHLVPLFGRGKGNPGPAEHIYRLDEESG